MEVKYLEEEAGAKILQDWLQGQDQGLMMSLLKRKIKGEDQGIFFHFFLTFLRFGTSKRQKLRVSDGPGPGAYNLPEVIADVPSYSRVQA